MSYRRSFRHLQGYGRPRSCHRARRAPPLSRADSQRREGKFLSTEDRLFTIGVVDPLAMAAIRCAWRRRQKYTNTGSNWDESTTTELICWLVTVGRCVIHTLPIVDPIETQRTASAVAHAPAFSKHTLRQMRGFREACRRIDFNAASDMRPRPHDLRRTRPGRREFRDLPRVSANLRIAPSLARSDPRDLAAACHSSSKALYKLLCEPCDLLVERLVVFLIVLSRRHSGPGVRTCRCSAIS